MQHRLNELFHLQMGKTPSREKLEYWEKGTNKWISISDLSNCSMYTAETKEAITDCAVRETNIRLVPKNTVIMSFKLSIGKTAITSEPVYTNEAIMAFVNKDEKLVLPEFLYYQLLSKDWGSAGNRAVMGATLNKASLSQMKINVPSLQEQQGIVQVLSQIDSQLKKADESVNKLDDLVKSRFVEMFGDCHCEKKSIGDLVYEMHIGPFGSAMKSDAFVSEEEAACVVYEQKHAIKQSIDLGWRYVDAAKKSELKRFAAGPGTILVSCRGTIGKVFQLPDNAPIGIIHPSVMKIEIDESKLNGVFFSFLLEKLFAEAETRAVGSGVKMAIKAKDLASTEIEYPPIQLQQEFAAFVAQVDKLRFEACYAMYLLCAAFTLL